jgi:hypothetical protein
MYWMAKEELQSMADLQKAPCGDEGHIKYFDPG